MVIYILRKLLLDLYTDWQHIQILVKNSTSPDSALFGNRLFACVRGTVSRDDVDTKFLSHSDVDQQY